MAEERRAAPIPKLNKTNLHNSPGAEGNHIAYLQKHLPFPKQENAKHFPTGDKKSNKGLETCYKLTKEGNTSVNKLYSIFV